MPRQVGGGLTGYLLGVCEPYLDHVALALFWRLLWRASLNFHAEIVVQKIFVSTLDTENNCTTINADKEKPSEALARDRGAVQPSFRQIVLSNPILAKAPNDGKLSMANLLAADKQSAALRLLVEGNSIRSIERITGVHRDTIMRLSVRFGDACREFLDEEMRGLTLRHIQCDEIATWVAKRQKNLTIEEKQSRHEIGEFYLWTALDMDTKLVPTFIIGKRSADMARRLMVDLSRRVVLPRPQEWHSENFRKTVQVSTDGFAGYPEAVDLAFGPYVKFGTIIKDYRNADRKPGNYSPAEIVGTRRKARFGMREDEMDTICTSHVERNNLTIRTFMKRFQRLTLGFSKKLENLAAATALHMAYYNFVWQPRPLKGSTPAMAANVTRRLWSFDDLFAEVKSRYLQS